MTDRPPLSPAPPGRSALPAFLPLEAWAREQLADARQAAEERLAEARTKASLLREEGRERLREAVLEGEKEALREVEDRARDRVSDARRAVDAWVAAAEADLAQVVSDAVELLTRAPIDPPRSLEASGHTAGPEAGSPLAVE